MGVRARLFLNSFHLSRGCAARARATCFVSMRESPPKAVRDLRRIGENESEDSRTSRRGKWKIQGSEVDDPKEVKERANSSRRCERLERETWRIRRGGKLGVTVRRGSAKNPNANPPDSAARVVEKFENTGREVVSLSSG